MRPGAIFRSAPALALLLASAACPGTLADPAAWEAATTDAGAPAGSDAGTTAPCPDIPSTFVTSCGTAGCHDATTKQEGLDLASPGLASRLVGVSALEGAGLLIDPTTPAHSVVYTKLLADPPFGARMPSATMALDAATIQCVLTWVSAEASAGPSTGGPSTEDEAGAGGGDAGGDDTGAASAFTTIRIAAGQTTSVTDAQGNVWSADEDFTGGVGAVPDPQIAIAGTDSPALYNGQRYGNPGFELSGAGPERDVRSHR